MFGKTKTFKTQMITDKKRQIIADRGVKMQLMTKKIISSVLSVVFLFSSVYVPDAFAKTAEAAVVSMPYTPIPIIEDIKIPTDSGSVKEIHRGPNGKLIIHIQDAHTNYEGQKNLAGILKELIEKYGINLVLVEGGHGDVSLSNLRHFSTSEERAAVADEYLKRGKIAGEEYLDIVSDPSFKFKLYGIEDENLYNSNLDQFLKIDKFADEANNFIASMEDTLAILKREIYSDTLRKFEEKALAYDNEEMDIVSYCEYLKKVAGVKDCDEIKTLLMVKELEARIDFAAANKERDDYIAAFSRRLSKDKAKELLTKTVEFKSNAVSPQEFYTYITGLGKEAGIDILDYPNLHLYTYYIRLFGNIDNNRLFDEITSLEDKVTEKLAGNAEQKELAGITKDLGLIKNFVNLKLAPADFKEFTSRREEFDLKGWLKTLNDIAKKRNLADAFISYENIIDKNLKKLEEFYRIAEKRDQAFFNNAIKVMHERSEERAVLIAGGFHTAHLMPLFKEDGYSYIVVSPRLENRTDFGLYRSLLKGELSAEEKIVKEILGALRVAAVSQRPVTFDALVVELAGLKDAFGVLGIDSSIIEEVAKWQEPEAKDYLPNELLDSDWNIRANISFKLETDTENGRAALVAYENGIIPIGEFRDGDWHIYGEEGGTPEAQARTSPVREREVSSGAIALSLQNLLEEKKIEADREFQAALDRAKDDPARRAEIIASALERRARALEEIKATADRQLLGSLSLRKLDRRDFLRIAAGAGAVSLLADQLFAQQAQLRVEEPPLAMSQDQMEAAYKFFETNRTSGGMPLSYRVAPKDYWRSINHPANTLEGIIERLLTTYSLNIYDGACGGIAEAILGRTALADRHIAQLLGGSYGDLRTIRANDGNFTFNGKTVGTREGQIRPENTWFFRMISDRYLQTDPLDGKTRFQGFPTWPDLHHEDWQPIAGEQAWAAGIGPLQVAYAKYGKNIPLDCNEVKLVLSILPCTEAMQSPIGAIYYAPQGTYGKSPKDISNENNISMFAALKMLLEVLEQHKNGKGVAENIATIRKILYGEGATHGGIRGYFKDYALDKEREVFYQGGFYVGGRFKPTRDFAVDVQTWGMLVFGPEQIDKWYGEGSAFKIWRNTKRRAGYFDGQGILRGIGFTDGHTITSGEWGFGAIMMLRSLARHYEKSHPEQAQEALQDSITMRRGIENELRMKLDDGSFAYKYANKRYYIVFGWWANPIPSLASTTWAVMVDNNFNPFVLGGGEGAKTTKVSKVEKAPVETAPEKTIHATQRYGEDPSNWLTWFEDLTTKEEPLKGLHGYEAIVIALPILKGQKPFNVIVDIKGEPFAKFRKKITIPKEIVEKGGWYNVTVSMAEIIAAMKKEEKDKDPQIQEVHFAEGELYAGVEVNEDRDNSEKFDIHGLGVPKITLIPKGAKTVAPPAQETKPEGDILEFGSPRPDDRAEGDLWSAHWLNLSKPTDLSAYSHLKIKISGEGKICFQLVDTETLDTGTVGLNTTPYELTKEAAVISMPLGDFEEVNLKKVRRIVVHGGPEVHGTEINKTPAEISIENIWVWREKTKERPSAEEPKVKVVPQTKPETKTSSIPSVKERGPALEEPAAEEAPAPQAQPEDKGISALTWAGIGVLTGVSAIGGLAAWRYYRMKKMEGEARTSPLALSRKEGERIVINGNIVVKVTSVSTYENKVILAIDAPLDISIARGELKKMPSTSSYSKGTPRGHWLVLSRRPKSGENQIYIGRDVLIRLNDITGNKARISITAPQDMEIMRAELLDNPPTDATTRTSPVTSKKEVEQLLNGLRRIVAEVRPKEKIRHLTLAGKNYGRKNRVFMTVGRGREHIERSTDVAIAAGILEYYPNTYMHITPAAIQNHAGTLRVILRYLDGVFAEYRRLAKESPIAKYSGIQIQLDELVIEPVTVAYGQSSGYWIHTTKEETVPLDINPNEDAVTTHSTAIRLEDEALPEKQAIQQYKKIDRKDVIRSARTSPIVETMRQDAQRARQAGRKAVMMVAMEGWSKEGGQADYVRELSQALVAAGNAVIVVNPCFAEPHGDISGEQGEHIFDTNVSMGRGNETLKAYYNNVEGVHYVRFKDSDGLLYPALYPQKKVSGTAYADSLYAYAEAILLSRAGMHFAGELGVELDAIHFNDWQAGFGPVYMEEEYRNNPAFSGELNSTGTVIITHNLAYQGGNFTGRISVPRDDRLFERLLAKGIIAAQDVTFRGNRAEFNPFFLTNLPEWLQFDMHRGLEFYSNTAWGRHNILKGGLIDANRVVAVSEGNMGEIQTERLGFGLGGVLAKRAEEGALEFVYNGSRVETARPDNMAALDEVVDEASDTRFTKFTASGSDLYLKKAQNKRALQLKINRLIAQDASKPRHEYFGSLDVDANTFLLTAVARLVSQKGYGILFERLDRYMGRGIQDGDRLIDLILRMRGHNGEKPQLVLMATPGDDMGRNIALRLQELARDERYRGQFAFLEKFDPALADQVYASGGVFLMPSHYEPGGISNIRAALAGSLCIVTLTGGLVDFVKNRGTHPEFFAPSFDYDNSQSMKNTAVALYDASKRAFDMYCGNKPEWDKWARTAMEFDADWSSRVPRYERIYEKAQEAASAVRTSPAKAEEIAALKTEITAILSEYNEAVKRLDAMTRGERPDLAAMEELTRNIARIVERKRELESRLSRLALETQIEKITSRLDEVVEMRDKMMRGERPAASVMRDLNLNIERLAGMKREVESKLSGLENLPGEGRTSPASAGRHEEENEEMMRRHAVEKKLTRLQESLKDTLEKIEPGLQEVVLSNIRNSIAAGRLSENEEELRKSFVALGVPSDMVGEIFATVKEIDEASRTSPLMNEFIERIMDEISFAHQISHADEDREPKELEKAYYQARMTRQPIYAVKLSQRHIEDKDRRSQAMIYHPYMDLIPDIPGLTEEYVEKTPEANRTEILYVVASSSKIGSMPEGSKIEADIIEAVANLPGTEDLSGYIDIDSKKDIFTWQLQLPLPKEMVVEEGKDCILIGGCEIQQNAGGRKTRLTERQLSILKTMLEKRGMVTVTKEELLRTSPAQDAAIFTINGSGLRAPVVGSSLEKTLKSLALYAPAILTKVVEEARVLVNNETPESDTLNADDRVTINYRSPLSYLRRQDNPTGQHFYRDNYPTSVEQILAMWEAAHMMGITTNLDIFNKAAAAGRFDNQIKAVVARGITGAETVYDRVTMPAFMEYAQLIGTLTSREAEEMDRVLGTASYEVPPQYIHDVAKTIDYQKLITNLLPSTVMVKTPSTEAGFEAVSQNAGSDDVIRDNMTLMFGFDQYLESQRAQIGKLERRVIMGLPIDNYFGVDSFFLSRTNMLLNAIFGHLEKEGKLTPEDAAAFEEIKDLVAVAQAKIVGRWNNYIYFGKELPPGTPHPPILDSLRARFERIDRLSREKKRLGLEGFGPIRPRIPLWASTQVKKEDLERPVNPVDALLYWVNLIGPNTVDTMPDGLIEAVEERFKDLTEKEKEEAIRGLDNTIDDNKIIIKYDPTGRTTRYAGQYTPEQIIEIADRLLEKYDSDILRIKGTHPKNKEITMYEEIREYNNGLNRLVLKGVLTQELAAREKIAGGDLRLSLETMAKLLTWRGGDLFEEAYRKSIKTFEAKIEEAKTGETPSAGGSTGSPPSSGQGRTSPLQDSKYYKDMVQNLSRLVMQGLATSIVTSKVYKEASQEIKDSYQAKITELTKGVFDMVSARLELASAVVSEDQYKVTEAVANITRHAMSEVKAARLLEALPLPEEQKTVTYFVPKELYNMSKESAGLWDEVVEFMNQRTGRLDAYKLNHNITMAALDMSSPEALAEGISKVLNGSGRKDAVLYLPDDAVETLGPEGIRRLSSSATLVSYGRDLKEKAVFAEGLLAYGEGLRNLRRATLAEDIEKYGKHIEAVYKSISRDRQDADVVGILRMIYSDPLEFLRRLTVEFPPITPELHKWIMEYQKDRVIEAVTELAV